MTYDYLVPFEQVFTWFFGFIQQSYSFVVRKKGTDACKQTLAGWQWEHKEE